MRVVLDVNVVFAGVCWRREPENRIANLWGSDKINQSTFRQTWTRSHMLNVRFT